jgi:hypothetical protein
VATAPPSPTIATPRRVVRCDIVASEAAEKSEVEKFSDIEKEKRTGWTGFVPFS